MRLLLLSASAVTDGVSDRVTGGHTDRDETDTTTHTDHSQQVPPTTSHYSTTTQSLQEASQSAVNTQPLYTTSAAEQTPQYAAQQQQPDYTTAPSTTQPDNTNYNLYNQPHTQHQQQQHSPPQAQQYNTQHAQQQGQWSAQQYGVSGYNETPPTSQYHNNEGSGATYAHIGT